MKSMKLSQRDVNLILGVLSLIIIVAFIFFIYMPKYQEYKNEMEKIQPYRDYYQQAKTLIQNLPQLERNLKIYQDKQNQQKITKSLNENQLFITLEKLANDNQIDLYFQKYNPANNQVFVNGNNSSNPNTNTNNPNNNNTTNTNTTNTNTNTTNTNNPNNLNNSNTPNNPNNTNNTNNTNNANNMNNSTMNQPNNTNPTNNTNGVNNPTTQNNTNSPAIPSTNPENNSFSQTVPSGDYIYSMAIKGEYRSIMVFLFELRNLEFPATISQFKLTYNNDSSKDYGFPLEATFIASFSNKGGGNQ